MISRERLHRALDALMDAAWKFEWRCPKCGQAFTGDDSDSLEDRAWDHLERVHNDDSVLIRIARASDATYHATHEFKPGLEDGPWNKFTRKKGPKQESNFCKICGRKKDHTLHAVQAKDVNWRDRLASMELAERRGFAPSLKDGERYKQWLRDKDEARRKVQAESQ